MRMRIKESAGPEEYCFIVSGKDSCVVLKERHQIAEQVMEKMLLRPATVAQIDEGHGERRLLRHGGRALRIGLVRVGDEV